MILAYENFRYTPDQIEKVSKLIRLNLTEDLIFKNITYKYPHNHLRQKKSFFGYCVPATFVLLYLMDTETLMPMRGMDAEGESHWWLMDNYSKKKFDLTFDQFSSNEELMNVYKTGKEKGYYGFIEMLA